MATETVSHLDSADEKIDDKMNEEVKPSEQNLKAEETPLAKTEEKLVEELPNPVKEKTEEKPIPTTQVVDVPKADEKPDEKVIDESPVLAPLVTAVEEKIEKTPIAAPVVEEVVKNGDSPVLDDPVKEKLEVAKDLIHEQETSDVTEEVVEKKLEVSQDPIHEPVTSGVVEEKLVVSQDTVPDLDPSNVPEAVADHVEPEKLQAQSEPVKEEPQAGPTIESPYKEPVVQPEIVDVHHSSIVETTVKAEPLEISPAPEVVADAVKPEELLAEAQPVEKEPQDQPAIESIDKESRDQIKTADVSESSSVGVIEKPEEPLGAPTKEAESIKVEEPVHEVLKVDKQEEQLKVAKQFEEKSKIEPEGVTDEKVLEDAAPTKVEDTQEEKINEVLVPKSSDQVKSIIQDVVKGDDATAALPSVVEKAATEIVGKEPDVTSVVAELVKEEAVEPGKVEEKHEEKTLKKEGIEDKTMISDAPTEPSKIEDTVHSIITAGIDESLIEEKSRDAELVAENKDINDETPVSVESNKDEAVEKKLTEKVSASTEQVGQPQESQLEQKVKETVAEKVEEIAKPGEQNLEPSTKVEDDTKVSQDLLEENQAKPTQKQSNSILTKVKKTLVKAKKAIIGKSPGPKTIPSETKGDIEVK